MRDYTILIDGNYFIYSRLYVLPRPKQIPGLDPIKFMDTEKEVGILMRKLCIDFASEMRKFKNITKRIVFALDAKSWRKDLFPEAGYKGNREQDPTINWDNISKAIKEFSDLLAKQGVIVERIPGSEADDLIFSWVTHLNANNESCIVWSGDSDLMQLVNYNRSTDAFALWYDNTRGTLGVYPGFEKWLNTREGSKDEDFDIYGTTSRFYIVDQIKEELKGFIDKNNLKVVDVYCDEYVFQKILTGDKTDNITSVLEVPAKKPGSTRMNRVNDKKAKSVLDAFKKRHKRFSSIYLFEDNYKDEICQLVAREMKVTGKKDDIKRKLELNTQLILLHVSTIPDVLQKTIFEKIKNDYELMQDLELDNLLDKDKILKGTSYINPNYKNNDLPSKGAIGLF